MWMRYLCFLGKNVDISVTCHSFWFSISFIMCHTFKCSLHQCHKIVLNVFFIFSHPRPHKHWPLDLFDSNKHTSFCPYLSVSSQTDEERQQALQAFTAQSFLSSPQQNTVSSSGSGASGPAFPSPTSSSEHKTKIKRGPRKKQNEKYRLKYLRLRKAARAMIFVSKEKLLKTQIYFTWSHYLSPCASQQIDG